MKRIWCQHWERLPGVIVIDFSTDVTMIYNLISRLDGAEQKSSDMITVCQEEDQMMLYHGLPCSPLCN